MAISQLRMLELLRIADGLKAKLFDGKRVIDEASRELPADATPAQLWHFVRVMQDYSRTISIAPLDLETLAIEKAHFKLNAVRNAKEAQRQRLKRGKTLEDKIPRSTSPESIQVKMQEGKYAAITRELAPPPKLNDAASAAVALVASLNEDLVRHKLKINEVYQSMKLDAPYPDPYDDSEPLAAKHKEELGLTQPSDDGPF